jgi:hypothetical protein
VGCCCAERLCDDYDAAGAEHNALLRAQRRQTFLNPNRWKRNFKGNLVRKARYCGQKVTIFPAKYMAGCFCFALQFAKASVFFSKPYESEAAAQRGAFAAIDKH